MPHVRVNDLEMFYEDIGAGPPVLFLHNAFSRGLIGFSAQIAPFQKNNYRCLLPDMRGHGRTRSPEYGWTVPQLADDVPGFLDALGLERVHLVGYSVGGGAALHAAVRHPGRFASLTTIGCAGCVTDAVCRNADEYAPEALEAAGRSDFIELVKANHHEAHRGDWRAFLRETVRNWREHPRVGDAALERLRVPSLFIAGENDPIVAGRHVRRLAELAPDARCEVVAGCGHGPHMVGEKPEETNRLLLEFLEAHPLP